MTTAKAIFRCILISTAIIHQGCAPVSSSSVDRPSSAGDEIGGPGGGSSSEQKSQQVVFPAGRPVDLLLVIDTSGSMEPDSSQLASRMTEFVQKLKDHGMDWQMCLTTTDVTDSQNTYPWDVAGETKYLLKKTDLDRLSGAQAIGVFTASVAALFKNGGSGDERGVAALYKHVASNSRRDQACYREGAVLSTIVLSDEDERSFGGNKKYYDSKESQPHGKGASFANLEKMDFPSEYLATAQALGVRNIISHSIMTDSVQCRNQQRANFDRDQVSVGHIGTVYRDLSVRTGGHVGSICDANYSRHLLDFADAINTSMNTILLECEPKMATLEVSSSGKVVGVDFTYSINGKRMVVQSQTSDAFDVNVQYFCK